VRYNYGKEGSRKDYTPYSCLKIISTTPGVVRVWRMYTALQLRAATAHSGCTNTWQPAVGTPACSGVWALVKHCRVSVLVRK
jgi:DNA primase large subunit